jgi:hypothetical protein
MHPPPELCVLAMATARELVEAVRKLFGHHPRFLVRKRWSVSHWNRVEVFEGSLYDGDKERWVDWREGMGRARHLCCLALALSCKHCNSNISRFGNRIG